MMLNCAADALMTTLCLLKMMSILFPRLALLIKHFGEFVSFKTCALEQCISCPQYTIFFGELVSCLFKVLNCVVEILLQFVDVLSINY